MRSNNVDRLLVVANRLPVTLKKIDGQWKFRSSAGGLVSALEGLKKTNSFIWIGWPGFEVPDEDKSGLERQLLETRSCFPVFLPSLVADGYYNGFSNNILWPLFHYLPGDINFDEEYWNCYQKANQIFADTVANLVQDGDLIWIHDYHLMLLPNLVRAKLAQKGMENPKIGFFLHTPFPSSEVYRVLPVRKAILSGLLNSNLIGFHTLHDSRHFLSSCTRILGLNTVPNGVELDGRLITTGAFPIGIDPERFEMGLQQESIQQRITQLKAQFAGRKIMIGVDRLDYIKGVPHKLKALQLFLAKHPEFHNKVVLIQIAVPTRVEVEEYKQLISSVNELVGQICGEYGSLESMPIHFINRAIDFPELTALYAVADVCIVTSIRDGMNLVSYEYIACQADNHGVLVLSEFAGASQSLDGAILVNPWNVEELVDAYYEALTMPKEARERNFSKLYRYVKKHNAGSWGARFVQELNSLALEQEKNVPKLKPKDLDVKTGASVYLLDYDEVLAVFQNLPEFARPSTKLLTLLTRLVARKDTMVYLVSGRPRNTLDEWFDGTGVGLVAEHGAFYRHGQGHWIPCFEHLDQAWKDTIRPVFQHYTERTPGSFIEEKEINLAWHYRNTDPEFGSWQSAELQANLEKILSHLAVNTLLGPKTLELCPSVVDKSITVKRILGDLEDCGISVICFVGDGKTNESLFSVLSKVKEAATCSVGYHGADAKYHLNTAFEVQRLLESLV